MIRKTCVLGLGLMGSRVALRLAESGRDVVAWNRTPLAATNSLRDFATLAATPCEAVKGAEVIFLFLHDGEAVVDVLLKSGAAECLAPECLVIDMGTNSPKVARSIAAQLPASVRFVDAPVSGGTKGAEQGNLSIFLGARDEDVRLAKEELNDLGRLTHMGGVGAGQAAKLANQIFVACSIAGLAEGIAYGELFGIAPEILRSAMRGGLADSQILESIGGRMCAGDFSPSGRASTHLKDLDYAFLQIEAGTESLPTARAARANLQDLLEKFGDLDHAAMVLVSREALSGSTKLSEPGDSQKVEPQEVKF